MTPPTQKDESEYAMGEFHWHEGGEFTARAIQNYARGLLSMPKGESNTIYLIAGLDNIVLCEGIRMPRGRARLPCPSAARRYVNRHSSILIHRKKKPGALSRLAYHIACLGGAPGLANPDFLVGQFTAKRGCVAKLKIIRAAYDDQ